MPPSLRRRTPLLAAAAGLLVAGLTAPGHAAAPSPGPATAVPTSISGSSRDGTAFDFDEWANGDIQVRVRDQDGNPYNPAPGQVLNFHWVITPLAGTGNLTTAEHSLSTAFGGTYDIPVLSPGDVPSHLPPYNRIPSGTFALYTSLTDGGTGHPFPEFKILTVEVGEAAVRYTDPDADNRVVTAPGGAATVTGIVALEDGTPLLGRQVNLTYTRGTEGTTGSFGSPDATLTTPSPTITDAGGQFSAQITDTASSPDESEVGGRLTATSAPSSFGDWVGDGVSQLTFPGPTVPPAPYIEGVDFAPPPDYVAMGDSYSAGEGTRDYLAGTDVDSDRCHRSYHAYGPRLHHRVDLPRMAFVACSGAVTADFAHTNHAFPTERPQLDALQAATSLVTFTIGGNDVGFKGVLDACIRARPWRWDGYGCSDVDNVTSGVKRRLDALAGKGSAKTPDGDRIVAVLDLIRQAHRRAPQAEIAVVGYPRLFGTEKKYYFDADRAPSGYACDVGVAVHRKATVDYSDAQWMNGQATALNKVLAAAATSAHSEGVNAVFVDPVNAFGEHRFCGAKPNWFVRLSTQGTDPNPESFHPTADGQGAYLRSIFDVPDF